MCICRLFLSDNTMVETEVKFLIRDPEAVTRKLIGMGAICTQPEVHELNLRFDTPDGSMTSRYHVLRLRKDTRARLTFKGQAYQLGGVSARKEIEVEVSDFDAAQALLEALGYEVSMIYEKQRETYHLEDIEVVIDHTPLGNFVELEGPDPTNIKRLSDALSFDWDARSLFSYAVIFERVKIALGLTFRDMTFQNFKDVAIGSDILDLRPADVFLNN
jgi:adenylate cyclase class 2